MKTMYVVLGIAAIGGAVWWYNKNKNQGSSAPVIIDTSLIPQPASEAEATKIVKLPDTLLQNTSGNTGIMPPIITGTATNKITSSVPSMQVPQLVKPVNTISKASTILPSKLTYLRGLGEAFILN